VGAGTGATVGKALGPQWAVQGGIGYHSLTLTSGVTVMALVAVNALGSIVDPDTGRIIAGPRDASGRFADTVSLLTTGLPNPPLPGTNTTIGVVATDAALTKAEAHALARAAHDGLAWAVRPAHTQFDGDTLFALSVGTKTTTSVALGAAAAVAVSQAILRAVRAATSLHDIPAIRDLR
jgi:L-aminopeptidase/D-esterase-like protein